jgi:lipoate---protein ligase
LHQWALLWDNNVMHRLLLTLDTPAANLALDEALLDEAEATGPSCEILRVWEAPRPFVVLGRSSRVEQEVNVRACRELGVPILRRASGGAAVLAGPGCLMYAVVLGLENQPEWRGIPQAHAYVLDRFVTSLARHLRSVERAGTSDLVLGESASASWGAGLKELAAAHSMMARKFSGNSLRIKRTHFLYHGTLLYKFDLPLITECLKLPPRRPEYRSSRDHASFVANLPLSREVIHEAILSAWPAENDLSQWPRERVDELIRDRYGSDDWNLTFG